MKKGQNETHTKPYFNDGMTPLAKEGTDNSSQSYRSKVNAILDRFNSNKTLKSKNVARASKKKRK